MHGPVLLGAVCIVQPDIAELLAGQVEHAAVHVVKAMEIAATQGHIFFTGYNIPTGFFSCRSILSRALSSGSMVYILSVSLKVFSVYHYRSKTIINFRNKCTLIISKFHVHFNKKQVKNGFHKNKRTACD